MMNLQDEWKERKANSQAVLLPPEGQNRRCTGASPLWILPDMSTKRLPKPGSGLVPAAGYRHSSELNDAGSWGDYWSSSLNTANSDNARNLNFDSDEHDWNNNNRYYGFTVRPVRQAFVINDMENHRLTPVQLLADLRQAFLDASRHKRRKPYVLAFERDLERNLQRLAHDLMSRGYHARPSTCFIISDPKRREVFAAQFRDRIVHHLYYNYTHEMLERTFIADSYSCIRGRGTHFGIRRLDRHIRQESLDWTEPCHVLKLDIRGYFTHIDRRRLLDITLDRLHRMGSHRVSRKDGRRWNEVVDMEFVEYLTREIILLDPTEGCVMKGSAGDWDTLPRDKSLFHSGEDCGLPIGNLTSQLFSNVYLGVFDDYMKRRLHCRHYGRYVDDSFVVSADREWLAGVKTLARDFLYRELGLRLHEGKSRIVPASHGVEFLGAFVKPRRVYVSRHSLLRMKGKLASLHREAAAGRADACHLECSLNSFLGLLGHYRSYRVRKETFSGMKAFQRYGLFDLRLSRYAALRMAGERTTH